MDVIHHRDSLSFSLSLSTWTTEYRRIRRIIFIYDGDEKGGGRTKGEEDLRRSLIGSIRARARARARELYLPRPRHSGTSGPPAALIRAAHARIFARMHTSHMAHMRANDDYSRHAQWRLLSLAASSRFASRYVGGRYARPRADWR